MPNVRMVNALVCLSIKEIRTLVVGLNVSPTRSARKTKLVSKKNVFILAPVFAARTHYATSQIMFQFVHVRLECLEIHSYRARCIMVRIFVHNLLLFKITNNNFYLNIAKILALQSRWKSTLAVHRLVVPTVNVANITDKRCALAFLVSLEVLRIVNLNALLIQIVTWTKLARIRSVSILAQEPVAIMQFAAFGIMIRFAVANPVLVEIHSPPVSQLVSWEINY